MILKKKKKKKKEKKKKIQFSYIFFTTEPRGFNGESHIDFRTHCVIMMQRT